MGYKIMIGAMSFGGYEMKAARVAGVWKAITEGKRQYQRNVRSVIFRAKNQQMLSSRSYRE